MIYNLVIIGGGPGGIGTAVEAKYLGIKDILMIEKSNNHSHTIRKFYKDKKRVDKDWQGKSVELDGNIDFIDGTKESTLDYFDTLLDDDLIDTQFDCEVTSIIKENDIFTIFSNCGTYRAKNIVIAIGKMGKPNKPNYKIPPSITSLVNFNLDKCGNGENILVVGGGDSAVEYACELSNTNKVTLNYRQSTLSRPNPTNQTMASEYISSSKVESRFGVDIVSLSSLHGKVNVQFSDTIEQIYDRIIYAIGGTTPKEFLKSCGVALDEKSNPIFDDNYESNMKGIYIAGDIAFASGGSIAIALNHGYKIANHIINKCTD
ncbi:MAG: pyridine nucleotide-disulfide oxidoreductase [Sulfurovum sp. AS07-7]|nr:MAG: pyridine nucleotide-disulfide oxidoreductase [Sulfurovum sp. AS07-7]